jgi:hypothetical protein
MRRVFGTLAPQLAGMETKSRAPNPVRRGAVEKPARFVPISRADAWQIFYAAEKLELASAAAPKSDRSEFRSRHQGAIGREALTVLRVLISRFLNFRTGQLDPSYDAIARAAGMSPRTVCNALRRLHAAGILSWQTRRWPRDKEGTIRQRSNAYGFNGALARRHVAPARDEAGAPDPVPEFGLTPADKGARMLTVLGGAPPGSAAAALARLGARRSAP